jgi:hypothetical protein
MKTSRFILSVVAVLLGVAGAFASNALQDITNHGVKEGETDIFSTMEVNVCDNERPDGTQCTLNTTNTPLAFKVSSSSEPLYRQP